MKKDELKQIIREEIAKLNEVDDAKAMALASKAQPMSPVILAKLVEKHLKKEKLPYKMGWSGVRYAMMFKDGAWQVQYGVQWTYLDHYSDDVTPGGTYHSKKGVPATLNYVIRPDKLGKVGVSINLSITTAGGMTTWTSRELQPNNLKAPAVFANIDGYLQGCEKSIKRGQPQFSSY